MCIYVFIKELTDDHYSINKIKLYQVFVEVRYVLIIIKVIIFQVNIKLLLCKKIIDTAYHIEILPVVIMVES